MNKKIIPGITGLLSVIMALVPEIIRPVCSTGEKVMACHYTSIYIMITAIVICVFSLIDIISKKKASRIFRIIIAFTGALSCYLVPNKIITIGRIGLCANPEMACRAHTMPLVYIIAGIIALVSIIDLTLFFLVQE